MNEKNVKKLIRAKIILPLTDEKSVFWDSNGVVLLENIKKYIRKLFVGMNMRELIFPSIFDKKYFPYSIINEENIINIDEGRELLAPFSETLYLYLLNDFKKRGINYDDYKKVFCWTKGFINEKFHDLSYNSMEILRYECFSVEEEKNAVESWNIYNETLKNFMYNIFKVQPIEGERQGIRRFPKAERTYSFELKVDDDLYRTVFVSHILKKEFISDVGLLKGEQYNLLSSCFSQKAILSILLHHQDKNGIRIPSTIAPVRGVIVSDDYILNEDFVKIFNMEREKEIHKIMAEECAIWGIIHRKSYCKVVKRNGFEENNFESMSEALGFAYQYEKEFDMQLLLDSKEKNSIKICECEEEIESSEKFKFIRCCGGSINRNSMHKRDDFIEKQTIIKGTGRCVFCNKKTNEVVMVECNEGYTNHFRAIEE